MRPDPTSGRVSAFPIEQLLSRACDPPRALALAPLEKQQALAEDEAIEQEGLQHRRPAER
jgi:hypothetical protein